MAFGFNHPLQLQTPHAVWQEDDKGVGRRKVSNRVKACTYRPPRNRTELTYERYGVLFQREPEGRAY